ncbi:hypothetical protein HPB50_024006 [Hyalomma asiaticum]|uniref:Uncharacterized protein n=1 Tax=Hyalomma asiaticum TaxID=266040 RepID=A0ACB7T1G2_HYAAI|nr:hypothetical protein HPB50_024006 [Hyalomma asiaticum]
MKQEQALDTAELPSVDKNSQLFEDLPLYQPTMADVLDLIKHPPTTLAAPYNELVGINNEYRNVYDVRGDYDIRMRKINKRIKERRDGDVRKKTSPREGASYSTNSTTSNGDTDSRIQTRRIPSLKRPARPQSKGQPDGRRRSIPRLPPDLDRRQSREYPNYEPHPERLPRSRRPVWQPDDNGAARNARRGTRAPNRHRGSFGRTITPSMHAETSPPFSTEIHHGVKIVSEPGARRPSQRQLPAPETSLPRASIPEGAGASVTGVKDDPISIQLTEALAQEPLLPYDKVVDEDTTEAVDVSRLVEESSFDYRMRELEEQQERAETRMLLGDGDEPDPSLSPVEDDPKEEGDEEKNLSVIAEKPIINSPLAPQKPNATAEDDQMVEIEDLGYELAAKKNASSSKGRLLVPVVDDSLETGELANDTVNATVDTTLDIKDDITDEEITNLTLTDAKMKRRKYSIASRIRLGNETLNVERANATRSSIAGPSEQFADSNLRLENRNTSRKSRSSSFLQFRPGKSRNYRRNVAQGKPSNGTLDVSVTSGTDASSKVVTTIPPKISQGAGTAKLKMTNGTRKLRKNVTKANRPLLTTMIPNVTQSVGSKKPSMVNCSRKVRKEKVKSENVTRLTSMPALKPRRVALTKFRLDNNMDKVAGNNISSESNNTRSSTEDHGAEMKKELDKSNTTLKGKSRRKVRGTRPTTAKSMVVVRQNKTTFSGSNNASESLIEIEDNQPSNCTMILPKNHPPLTRQADASGLVSQLKYFEGKVQPRLPSQTTTPQELLNAVTKLRSYIIQSSLPRWSIDSDYFRKAGVFARLFPRTKRGVPVNFMFYSRNSSITPIALQHDAQSLQAVSLCQDSKLQVICHDFEQGASERWVKQLKDALLNEGKDNNVLVVGWRQAAARNYWTAVANSRPVGRKLACLLRRLRAERGLQLRNVHLVGFGLGAHVARYAAVSVIHKLCEKVGRVTGELRWR